MNSMSHNIDDLMLLFEQTFYLSHNTKLVKGASEPLYLPSNELCQYHQLIFANDYFASALHEISHWCLAGEERRLLEDFGYWYLPDGRTKKQQQNFEYVEIKPQAIEWAFSVASNKKFMVSADNLNGSDTYSTDFKHAVYDQLQRYLLAGFPPRAQQFMSVLANFYQVKWPLNATQFRSVGLVNN
jgi:hypothetical protein